MSRKSTEQRDRMAASLRREPAKAELTEPDLSTRPGAPRAKPVRITVDLAPDLHRRLKLWAVEADVSVADVLRTLATRMLDNDDQADDVRRELHA